MNLTTLRSTLLSLAAPALVACASAPTAAALPATIASARAGAAPRACGHGGSAVEGPVEQTLAGLQYEAPDDPARDAPQLPAALACYELACRATLASPCVAGQMRVLLRMDPPEALRRFEEAPTQVRRQTEADYPEVVEDARRRVALLVLEPTDDALPDVDVLVADARHPFARTRLFLRPGRYNVQVRRAGRSRVYPLDLAAGETRRVIDAPALPPPAPIYARAWFWTLVGGAVATGVGVGLCVEEVLPFCQPTEHRPPTGAPNTPAF